MATACLVVTLRRSTEQAVPTWQPASCLAKAQDDDRLGVFTSKYTISWKCIILFFVISPWQVGLGAYTDFGVGLVCTCGSLSYAGITKTECQTTPWAVFLGSDRVCFNAVRLLMIFSFIPLVVSFFMNFIFIYTKKLYPTREAAILTTLAGVLGVASFSTFVGWTATSSDLLAQVNYVSVQLERGWAFYLSAVGSCFILVCGGVSAYVSMRHPSYTVVQKQPTGGVINAGYVMQSQQIPSSGFVFGSVGVVQPQEKIADPRQVQLI